MKICPKCDGPLERDGTHMSEFSPCVLEEYGSSVCPVCGEDSDYCRGHGQIGDPYGYEVGLAHEADIHGGCHPNSDCRR